LSTLNRLGAVALAAALLLSPLAAQASIPARYSQDDAPTQAEQAVFNKGRDLFSKGQFEQAATVFRDFLKTNPNSFIADLMLLWLGRSYIELGQVREAEQVAARLRQIPDTPFSDIFDGELQTARRELASRPPAAARPTPTPAAVARATPRPTPARPVPTPAPTPNEIAANNSSSAADARSSEGVRPRRTTGRGRNSRRNTQPGGGARQSVTEPALVASTSEPTTARTRPTPTPTPRATPQPTPRATPVPTPARREPATVASNTGAATRPPVPMPAPTPTPVVNTAASTAQPVSTNVPAQGQTGVSIVVKQVPDLQLALRRAALAAQPGQTLQLPLVLTNTGNKEDQFRVETDLPAEYQPTFSQRGTDTGLPIFVTPQMPRGTNIEVMLNLRVPDNAPDNQQQRFLVRAASQADTNILKVADASLTVVAAALIAQTNVLQEAVQPGETFTQRISVRNQGSASARSTRADFVFNPDFEMVSATPAPINYDRPSRTAIWSLGDLESRDVREITVTLRAVSGALASTGRAVGRGTMRTQSLVIPSNFDGPSISVGRVPGARVDSVSTGLTATPGDTVYIPFVVRNPSNYPESFNLQITAPGAPQATIYADANGDGQHQENEPAVTQTATLDPRGGQFPVLLRVDIPRSTPDRQQYAYNLVTRAVGAGTRTASEASTVLTVAAPRARVRSEVPNTEVSPGDTFFYRLVLVNDGSGLARNLVVQEFLPEALQFVSSSPQLSVQDAAGGARSFVWRVPELAPGDTTVLLVTVRLNPNLRADDVVTTRHTLTYQDSNGNSYSGQ
jgi:uncharacterized repeat protein (TIGR01451 family)